MSRRAPVAAACALLAVAAVAAPAAPAAAQTRTTQDARGDVAVWDSATQQSSTRSTNVDILKIRVRYDGGSLVVRTWFKDLTKRNTTTTARVSSLHNYWFDTNPDRRGYEYTIYDARGENLHRLRTGADGRVTCRGLSWKANLDTDVTTLVVPRSCFRKGERASVKVKFFVQQIGPGRTDAGGGSYFVDTMEDAVVTGLVRHTRTS